jgi:chromate transporter
MTEKPAAEAEGQPRASLGEVAWLFLRLGLLAFGGPAAHIALMEEEVVRRKRWLSREQFLDLLAATHLIPGPNSTEMAIYIGSRVAGRAGLLLAGVCFILPSALLVTALAWAYITFRTLPEVAGLLSGVKPVLIAVILQALWRLGVQAVRTPLLAVVGLLAGVAVVTTPQLSDKRIENLELLVLLAAGVVTVAARRALRGLQGAGPAAGCFAGPVLATAPAMSVPFGVGDLFLVFLKIGSVLFGSGYVLFVFLRADLVEQRGWLNEQELLDAIAVGQVTPGPVSTAATFIGYVLGERHGPGGWVGAAVATLGIFLPAFVFVALSAPLVPRLRRSPTAGAFLDGVVVASLALMAVVTWDLGKAALVDRGAVDLLAAAVAVVAVGLLWLRVNATWLVLGGAVFGVVRALVT